MIALILRAEELYNSSLSSEESSNVIVGGVNQELNEQWSQFLLVLSSSLNRTIQHQTISAAIESDSIQPMMNHFSRFHELKLDSLFALFSEAKQQVD